MFKMWVNITAFAFLGICALFDGIKREVPLVVIWIGIMTACVLQIKGAMGETSWPLVLLSMSPGICFWLLSFLTGEKVGYGDGWLLLMVGLFLGFEGCFLTLLLGLVAESVAVLILLGLKKIKRDEEVAFAPFLLVGMGLVLWL